MVNNLVHNTYMSPSLKDNHNKTVAISSTNHRSVDHIKSVTKDRIKLPAGAAGNFILSYVAS